jgi:hypothetical protein
MNSIFFKKTNILFVLLVLLIFTVPVFSQVSITLLLSPTLQNAQVVYVSSFDFIQQGIAQFLFQVTVENTAGVEQRGQLIFEVVKDGEVIALARTNFFILPADPPIITFNNIQLSNGFILPNGESLRFDETDVQSPNDDFKNESLQSGRLPGGRYFFTVEFEKEIPDDIELKSIQELEVISSPYVLPVAPGTEDLSAPEVIYTPFPVFQFNTNLTDPLALAGEPFIIEVYKKLDYHTSADEVLTTTPHLEFRTGTTLFQYPQGAGEQPLEPGGSYLWRVQMVLITTNGTEIISSPLFAFNYTDPSNASEDIVARASADEVLRLLKYLIGNQADVYAEMLSAYKLTTMRINGETVDLTDLYNKIIRYEGKVFKVSDIDLLAPKN